LLIRTSPIDALERGAAGLEAKYRCRRFVNNSVFADRKLIWDNGRSHLFLLRNSIPVFDCEVFALDIAGSFEALPEAAHQLLRQTLHDADVDRVCRRFSNGTSDRGVPLGPSDQLCKLFGAGIIRTDLNGRVERRHARRNAIVESQNPAVIAVAFNGNLEHCEIHAEAGCAHGNHGRAA
jgi:hypothetical protein